MIEVNVYDDQCSTLRHAFDILAIDPAGRAVLDSQPAAARGSRWGAVLQWVAPGAVDIYEIVVDDPTFTYAQRVIGDFNAAPGGKLDVIIENLPQSGYGGGFGGGGAPLPPYTAPTPLQTVFEEIREAPDWTPSERRGVALLLESYIALRTATEPSLQQRVQKWRGRLQELGVDVRSLDAVKIVTSSSSGSSTPAAPTMSAGA